MFISNWISLDELSQAVAIVIKLLLAILLASAIGWERKAHGRPAGLRTHVLVAMGVVLFCEASKAFSVGDGDRIAAQVVTGIGFLGAGTILRMGVEIKGLTSAASIWATAAIGMAVSTGGPLVYVAVAATGLALVTLTVLDRIEQRYNPGAQLARLSVELSERTALANLLLALHESQIEVGSIEVVGQDDEVHVLLTTSGFPEKGLEIATGLRGVKSAKMVE